MEVFANQKDAIAARNMKSNSFTRAIQQESLSSGHYLKFWEDCSEEMRTEFLKHNNLPEKYKTTAGNFKNLLKIKKKYINKLNHLA